VNGLLSHGSSQLFPSSMSQVPSRMRYIGHGTGGPAEVLKLEEGPVPVPREGEVLIKVAFAGINRPDISQRAGLYPPPLDASPVLGLEVSGTVAAVGEGVASWAIGDGLCALVPGGGYAEYCRVSAAHCLPIPAGLSLLEAASLPENYFTVWATVFEQGRLQPGEGLLVHGGTSGIGLAAIQLAKLNGAIVATTVGNDEKVATCRAMGADCVVNYRETDFVEAIREAGLTIDVVLDMVGGSYADKHVALLAVGGRLIQIATLGGAQAQIDAARLMMKRITWTGSTMRRRSHDEKAALATTLESQVWPAFTDGRLKPVIDRVYPLAEAAAAHARMESSQHIGKLMLSM
jgi:NADPH2:quinone reductase